MAIAIWGSAAHLRPSACFHSTGGIVGDWVSGHSLRNQQSPSLPQATVLSACWSECSCRARRARGTSLYVLSHCLGVWLPFHLGNCSASWCCFISVRSKCFTTCTRVFHLNHCMQCLQSCDTYIYIQKVLKIPHVDPHQFRESLREFLREFMFLALLKSVDAIPRMGFPHSENIMEDRFLKSESCSENTSELSESSEIGLFTSRTFGFFLIFPSENSVLTLSLHRY